MPNTYTLIQSVTVGSGGAARIEFGSIPQTYTDIKLVWSARTLDAQTSNALYMSFNGLTTNFSFRRLRGTGSSADSFSESTSTLYGTSNGNNATASVFSNGEIYIPNYAGNTNKSFSVDSVTENNATDTIQVLFAGLWSNTAAINRISFASDANIAQYSSMSLYGIKNS